MTSHGDINHRQFDHLFNSSIGLIIKKTSKLCIPDIWEGTPPMTDIHYSDVIMCAIAPKMTSLTIVYSIVYSGADQRNIKLRATGLCAGNSPVTGEFPTQMASNAENASIWSRHHVNIVYSSILSRSLTVFKVRTCMTNYIRHAWAEIWLPIHALITHKLCSWLAPSQWETSLHSLSLVWANLESALC